MSWDPFQREVLAELGHVVYRRAGTGVPADAEAGSAALTMDHAMLAHVARAAGMTPEALQARISDIRVIAGLHGNAAAKRALWPRLRALRRKQG